MATDVPSRLRFDEPKCPSQRTLDADGSLRDVGHARTITQEQVTMSVYRSSLGKALPWLAVAAMSCSGKIGEISSSDPNAPGGRPGGSSTGTGTGPGGVSSSNFACDPSAKPPVATLRRLTS